jgi:D-amino-acid dehydrogenase
MRIAIIGAGIVGITVAHALLDEGHGVSLFDPDGFAERTSRGNAGFIAHTDIYPLASPKVWRQLPRWLLDPVGPLTIRARHLPHVLPWMLRFLAASRPSRVEASTAALIALNGLALPAWERRLGKLGLADQHLRRRGYLYVFTRPGDQAALAPMVRRQEQLGIPVQMLNGAGLRKLEPAFGEAALGAVHYLSGVSVDDPKSIADALGKAVLARGAALTRTSVAAVMPREGGVAVETTAAGVETFDMAVIAAGIWSKALAAGLGDNVPLESERGYNLTLPKGALGLTRSVILEGQGVALSPMDGADRIGGAVEFAGITAPPNDARIDAILTRTRRFLPQANFADGTRWMGHRPSLPDSLPVISRSSASDRIIYAFGNGHHGLTQAAAMAEIAAAVLAQRRAPIDPMPFAADRFPSLLRSFGLERGR